MRRYLLAAAVQLIVTGCVTTASSQGGPTLYTDTFVASYGTEGNTTCSVSAPCKFLSAAVGVTAVNGNVTCLDPYTSQAGFTIARSININCATANHVITGTTTLDNSHISINIPESSADVLRTVRIRGVATHGAIGSGRFSTRGVSIVAASAVFLEGVVISDYVQQGIVDKRTGGQTRLFVTDSIIRNNGGPGIVASSGAPGIMVLDNVKLLNNLYGLAAASGNNVTLKNATISGNIQAGVLADGGAQINVENSTITNNNAGVLVGGIVRLWNTNISFNNQAVSGNAISLGGNRFSGNSSLGNVPPLASGAPSDTYN